MRVVVAGAGVFGSAIAMRLTAEGAAVTLADPAAAGDNASGAAAGMLAPAFEAVLDAETAGLYPLLLQARDLWPGFAAGAGEAAFGLHRSGAAWIALADDPPDLFDRRRAGLEALGCAVEAWPAARLAVTGEGLGPALYTSEDWALDPTRALTAMQAAVPRVRAAVAGFEPGRARLSTGETIAADALIVATGADPSGLAPELAALSPIKGHILRYPARAALAVAPTLRCRLGYAAGGLGALCVGATMEPGRADRTIDPDAVRRLGALAARLFPDLAQVAPQVQAAVRAASPDSLPLVGPSSHEGVFVAAGARRNGWLLAPLVAKMTAAYLAGRDPGPDAARLDARRFASA